MCMLFLNHVKKGDRDFVSNIVLYLIKFLLIHQTSIVGTLVAEMCEELSCGLFAL